jgi:hypothetical protein
MPAEPPLRIAAKAAEFAGDPLFCRTPTHGNDQRRL